MWRMGLLVAVFASASLSAATAKAQEADKIIGYGVASGVGGSIVLTFGIADAVSAATRGWLHQGWAVAQIIVGGVGCGIASGVSFDIASKDYSYAYASASVLGAASLWFLVHGILSMHLGGNGRAAKRRHALVVLPSVGSLVGGHMIFAW